MILTDNTEKGKECTLSAVARIESECFSVPWTKRAIESQIYTDGAVFALLITDDGEAAGFVCGQTASDECELYRIAVLPKYRGQGNAAKLMTRFIDECRSRGIKNVFLEVRQGNTAARRLYERFSFVPGGRRKNYYSNPTEDAVVYRLSIDCLDTQSSAPTGNPAF